MIVLNSFPAALDLLEKRSAKYSDRPYLPSADISGFSNILPLTGYGERFREQRRMLTRVIGSRTLVEKFGPLQQHATNSFLGRLMQDPNEFLEHIKK